MCHPFNRRGWADWGAGPLGDMSAHLIDHADWALDLGLPTTVETVSTPFNGVCFPHAGADSRRAARDELGEVGQGGNVPVSCLCDYAAKLTEVMLLGIVSLRSARPAPRSTLFGARDDAQPTGVRARAPCGPVKCLTFQVSSSSALALRAHSAINPS